MTIKPKDLSKKSLDLNSNLRLFQIYKNLKHVSLKWDTYFQAYEEILGKYVDKEITFVEVPAGGGSFHHGWTWHGSGTNTKNQPRRALVLHAMRSDVEYIPENFSQGIGRIYSRYKRLSDNILDENYFPILWQKDGYRTPQIDDYLNN